MITYEQIDQLERETALPFVTIVRALAAKEDRGRGGGAPYCSIDIASRSEAEALAVSLVGEGLRFSCEAIGTRRWRFAVRGSLATVHELMETARPAHTDAFELTAAESISG